MSNLKDLIIFRNIANNEILNGSLDSISSGAQLINAAEKYGLSGNLYQAYLIFLMIYEPNLISTTIEKNFGRLSKSLYEIFRNDIKILKSFLNCGYKSDLNFLNDYTPTSQIDEIIAELSCQFRRLSDVNSVTEVFIEHYRRHGYADIAKYRTFFWDKEKKLVGVSDFNDVHFEDLIGYEHQKKLLKDNTKFFLEGKPANNVLLVGARGTGKSSSVKALVNEYSLFGLRLLQVTKSQFKNFSEIIRELKNFPSRKFIIFLDDLSFEESETEYKYLKSAIEGGIEKCPENILIYATSNRRHLIHETWKNRSDELEELYRDDGVNETLSLSERFGLIIHYSTPSQAEYLDIVRSKLERRGIKFSDEKLRVESTRWEMSHSGRSGRTAQQFVNYYLGRGRSEF